MKQSDKFLSEEFYYKQQKIMKNKKSKKYFRTIFTGENKISKKKKRIKWKITKK